MKLQRKKTGGVELKKERERVDSPGKNDGFLVRAGGARLGADTG